MDASFDPYRKWLGIRTRERPPNHYQLLGLGLFEDDPETISHAADQRIAYVRTLAVNEYADVSQRVLNELAAAKVALLSRDKKTRYDAELQAQFVGALSSPALPTDAAASAASSLGAAKERRLLSSPATPDQRHTSPASWDRRRVVICSLCVALTLPLSYWAFGFARRPASPQVVEAAHSPPEVVVSGSVVKSEVKPIQESGGSQDQSAQRTNPPAPPPPAAPPELPVAGAPSGGNQGDASALNVTGAKPVESPDAPMEPPPAVPERPATKPIDENRTSPPLNSPAITKPKPVEPLKQYKGHQGPVTSIAFNFGGKSFVSAGGGRFLVWQIGTDQPMATVYAETGDDGDIVALSPKGTHIVRTSRRDGNVDLYEVVRRRIIKSIPGRYNRAGFTPDVDGFFCIKRDEVEGWSLATGGIVQRIVRFRDDPLKNNWCRCGDVSKDGALALTAGREVISLWDLTKRKIYNQGDVGVPAIKHIHLRNDEDVGQVYFIGDTQHAVTISDDDRHYGRGPGSGVVRYWDLQAGVEVAAGNKLTAASWINACPDRFRVFIRGSDGILYVDDEMAGKAMPATAADARVNCMAASPDGETLLTGGNDGVISQWDVSELLAAGAKIHSKPAAGAIVGADAAAAGAPADVGAVTGETEDRPKMKQPLPGGIPEHNGHPLSWWFDEYKKHYHYCYSFELDQRNDRLFANEQAALTALEREKESASALVAAARSDPRVLSFYLESLAVSMRQVKVASKDALQWSDQASLINWADDLDVDGLQRRHSYNGWKDLPEEIRRSYMAILIASVGPSAIPTLTAALEKPQLRHAGVVALSLFGDEGLHYLLPVYSRGAAFEDKRIVFKVIDAIRYSIDRSRRSTGSGPEGGFFDFGFISEHGHDSPKPRKYGRRGGYNSRRAQRSELTANAAAELRAALLDAAGDEDSPIACAAAEMLVRWKALPDDCGEQAIPALKRLLRDKDDAIRGRAIELLCELGPKLPAAFQELGEAVKEGSPVLSNDKHSFLIDSHNNVAGEWRFLSLPEALPVLLALLEFSGNEGKLARSETNVLRNKACRALVAAYRVAPKPEIIGALRKLLADRDVQDSAAKSLGEIGPAAELAIPELERLAKDPEASDVARTFAKAAMKRIVP